MADEIEIGSKAIKQVQDLRAELIKLSQEVMNVNKNTINITTPGGLNKSVNDNAKAGVEIDALKAKYVSLSDTIAKKAEQSRLAEIRLQQQREKAFDDYSKKIAKQEQELSKKSAAEEKASQKAIQSAKKQQEAEERQALSRRQAFDKNDKKIQEQAAKELSAYQRIQTSVTLLTKTYNDLAIRKELGNTLTAKEEKQLASLSARINTYQTALKNTDAQIGKNQRNVGNYASGWNALGNSVNQLTRELPAAAVSLNTLFLAWSNNIPIFFDAVKGAKDEIAALRAEGKQTQSLFSRLTGAFFSWGTALSVGVTLLTLFGGKLVETVLGLGNVEAALKKVEAQQKRNNAALEQANKNIDHNLVLEKNRLKELGASDKELAELDKEAAARKLKNFETARDIAKKELDIEINKVLSKRGINAAEFSDEVGLAEKLNQRKLALEKSLGKELVKFTYLARTEKEKADVESLAKTNKKISILEALNDSQIYQKKKEAYSKAANEVLNYGQTVSEINSTVIESNKDAEKAEEERLKAISERQRKELELQLANIDVKLNNEELYYTERLSSLDKDFLKRTEIAKLDYDEEFRLAKGNQDKQKTALINFQLEKLKLIEGYNKQRTELEALDLNAITTFDPDKKSKTDTDPFKYVTESTDRVVKRLKDFGDSSDALKKKIAELRIETQNWLGSFNGEFLQNSGLGSLQTFFDGTFNKLLAGAQNSKEEFAVYFNSIAESAQEAFNFISNASQQNFDSERERLQNQYDIALTYAGENKAAQTKLAEDLEKQKKDIANRENKAKQKQAIFNIAVDTAQAIIGLWAKPGFPAAVPLAIAVGALGAAQIALVASQKIPQYWMGGTHDGGLMMVNDGKGSNFQETIVTPDGKVMKPQGRNVIMDAPKGTEIFTHDQWSEQMNNMLKGNGINWSLPQNNYSGISKDDLEDVMLRTLGSQPKHIQSLTKKGIDDYIDHGGNKTKSASNRGNSIKTRFT